VSDWLFVALLALAMTVAILAALSGVWLATVLIGVITGRLLARMELRPRKAAS
jgi:hypothetical protein